MENHTFKMKNTHNILFFSKDGTQVGEFNFDKAPVTFTGDADASARIFIDIVLNLWNKEKM